MVWKTGWARTISADRPDAAAVPCTMLELVTPTAAHPPRRRPAARVFLVTTAKSGPGISTSTVAKTRNSAYVDQVITGMLRGALPGARPPPRTRVIEGRLPNSNRVLASRHAQSHKFIYKC